MALWKTLKSDQQVLLATVTPVHLVRPAQLVHPARLVPPVCLVHPARLVPPVRLVHPVRLERPAQLVHPVRPERQAQLAPLERLVRLARLAPPERLVRLVHPGRPAAPARQALAAWYSQPLSLQGQIAPTAACVFSLVWTAIAAERWRQQKSLLPHIFASVQPLQPSNHGAPRS